MSTENNHYESGRYNWPSNAVGDHDQDLQRAVEASRQTLLHDERRCAGLVDPDQGAGSSRAEENAQEGPRESLPRPDTGMFEELAKLSPNAFSYMITSNIKRKLVAEVHYWATLGDLLHKDISGRTVAYMSMADFLRRIYFELHIRNSRDDNVGSTFTLFAQFGLDNTLHMLDQTDHSISNAIYHYDAFLESTDMPDYKRVLRFHLEFSSRPEGYFWDRPSQRITNHYLSLLKNPILVNSDGTWERQAQETEASDLQILDESPSVNRPNSARTGTLADFIPPTSRQGQTIESVVGRLPDSKVPLRQLGRQLIPESLLRLDGIFSENKPNVLLQLGPRMGVAGIYNLDEGLLDTTSPTPAAWWVCCSLLPDLDPDELSRDIRARSIPILRSTLSITPPQFYSAVEILRRPAGFLAHDMGIGKTHTVLAAAALRTLILKSKQKCEQAWSSGSRGQHLDRNARPQEGQVCPSQIKRPGDVQCYCVPGGLTREIGRLARGVSLIQIPANSRAEWINAVTLAKFNTASYDFVVVSQSSDVPAELKRGREFFKMFGSNWKLNSVLGPGNQTAPQNLQAADFDWEIGAKFGYLESYVFIIAHTDTTWYNMFKWSVNGLPVQIYAAPVGLSFIDEAHNPDLWAHSGPASHTYNMAR